MTTPAVDVQIARLGINPGQYLRWWGEWQDTTYQTLVIDKKQKRPASTTIGKAPDGQWNRGAWSHYWYQSGGIPVGYSFSTSNASGGNLAGARSGSDCIVQSGPFLFSQLAPWLVNPSVQRTPELFNLENATRTKILNKLREQNVNLGVALGEIDQTAGFVNQLCHTTLDVVETVRRKSKTKVRDVRYWLFNGFDKTPPWHRKGPAAEKRIKRSADTARSAWLQGQFALKPLLQDIEDSAATLDKYVNGESVPDTRVRVKAGSTSARTGYVYPAHSTMGGTFDYPVAVGVSSACHGSCDYHVPVSWTRTFESLGLGNPAALAHELVPYSWLLDYVVGAGSWLSSLSADRGATFLGGSLSYVQRVESVTTSSPYRTKAPGVIIVTISQPALKMTLKAGRFERVVVSGTFLPALLPPLKNRMNLTRMANSIFALTNSYGPNLRT